MVHPHLFWEAVLRKDPYPIKALLIMASNPLVSQSDPAKMFRAMDEIEFIVTADMFMTNEMKMVR